jgi:ubiquinone/menaquinone biosynthesis C-methylase UbiE
VSGPIQKPESDFGYRLMVLTYRIQELLGLGKPEKQLVHAPIEAGARLVEWGCGPGRVTIPLAKLVGPSGTVLAVDIQPLALEIVGRKAARAGLDNVETLLFASHPAPISTASADVVVLIDTFHAVTDREELLSDIARILKPSGALFMDPGHMDLQKACSLVQASGLFQIRETWDRDMLFGRIP